MRKFFLTFSVFFVSIFLGEQDFFASSDITKTDFMIDLTNLDPLTSGNTIAVGRGAVTEILAKLADVLLFIMPLVAAASLIIAGYYYILSAWDTEKATQSKKIIQWNAVAISVALFSYAIIKLVSYLLGGTI